jgi:hypothetical protein
MSNYTRRVIESQFREWLEEEVYISKGLEYAPRKYAIYWFIEDLCDFIKAHGYTFRDQVKEIAQDWARFLFRAHNRLNVGNPERNPDHSFEDYDWYFHRFDYPTTESFLKVWNDSDDYTKNTPSELLLANAFHFAWSYINIKASSETQKVDEMLEVSDSDEEGQKRRRTGRNPADPYLEDQANAASKYNRWD